jgi:hypothetical protein
LKRCVARRASAVQPTVVCAEWAPFLVNSALSRRHITISSHLCLIPQFKGLDASFCAELLICGLIAFAILYFTCSHLHMLSLPILHYEIRASCCALLPHDFYELYELYEPFEEGYVIA